MVCIAMMILVHTIELAFTYFSVANKLSYSSGAQCTAFSISTFFEVRTYVGSEGI